MPASAEKDKKRTVQAVRKRDKSPAQDMSKLPPSLKALVNAPFARPGQAPAPRHIRDVYARIANEARERRYGFQPWVTLSAAATFTLNSPDSLLILHSLASASASASASSNSTATYPPPLAPLAAAELIREVGLKCISFNGIPRTINCLGAFRAGLADQPWAGRLSARAPSRQVDRANVDAVRQRGRDLWRSVYTPFDDKLEAKLAESHPDLPVHILGSHYGPLLSDPPSPPAAAGAAPGRGGGGSGDDGLAPPAVGRNLTSVVAVACLRAQTGVGPQVLSHVFGLRKGVEQGLHLLEFEGDREEAEGVERLAGDEGCEWLLKSVDSIAEAIGGSFARWESDGEGNGGRAREAKL